MWSLAKLAEHLTAQKIVPTISGDMLRRILREGKVTWQSTTTTWRASTDPDFLSKMHVILAIYDTPPAVGRLICVDESGPLNLQPRKGNRGDRPHIRSGLRATYHRYDGVMRMLVAPDLSSGRMYYRIRPRKRAGWFLGFLKVLRARWPGEKLYVVLDNFSPHRHPAVREWTADNDVEWVFLPTYGSWLNWIESDFAAWRHSALNGTDHRSHAEQNAAIAAYMLWRNARGTETRFAPDSPVRSWTEYLHYPGQGCLTSH
ncbi:IS630 family transposase [Rhodococcus sp. DMU1]|uniref:IS630 family transposase n=1 Tax=Rhodococcus sp. DMU1 TaxID=2722825 RepID=UPI0024A69472|nr:IS630 family transposase [Rhodococcus sp. DMU1]